MKRFIKLLPALIVFAILMNSCAVRIEKRTFNKGYMIDFKKNNKVAKVEKKESNTSSKNEDRTPFTFGKKENDVAAIEEVNETKKPATSSSNKLNTREIDNKSLETPTLTAENSSLSNDFVSSDKPISKLKAFKTLKKTIKEHKDSKKSSEDLPLIVLVLLAIFIPPLAVYFVKDIGTEFWISLILTLLFWVPGIVYALLIVLDVI